MRSNTDERGGSTKLFVKWLKRVSDQKDCQSPFAVCIQENDWMKTNVQYSSRCRTSCQEVSRI